MGHAGKVRPGSQAEHGSNKPAAVACSMYCVSAVAVAWALKSLFTNHGFRFPFFMMAAQMAVAVIATTLVGRLGLVDGPFHFDAERLKAVVPQALVNMLNVAVGFMAMSRANMPLFLCMRRTVLLFVAVGEWLLLGKTHNSIVIASISAMVFGSLLAAWDGLHDAQAEASWSSVVFVFINNCLTSLFLILSKRFSARFPATSSLSLMRHQAAVSLPAALLVSLFMGEVRDVVSFSEWGDVRMITIFICAATCGSLVAFSITYATKVTTPLVLCVSGSVKDLSSTALSMLAFTGFHATPTAVLGIALSMVGGITYAANKAGLLTLADKPSRKNEPLAPTPQRVDHPTAVEEATSEKGEVVQV